MALLDAAKRFLILLPTSWTTCIVWSLAKINKHVVAVRLARLLATLGAQQNINGLQDGPNKATFWDSKTPNTQHGHNRHRNAKYMIIPLALVDPQQIICSWFLCLNIYQTMVFYFMLSWKWTNKASWKTARGRTSPDGDVLGTILGPKSKSRGAQDWPQIGPKRKKTSATIE
jgi:hypothetical protein